MGSPSTPPSVDSLILAERNPAGPFDSSRTSYDMRTPSWTHSLIATAVGLAPLAAASAPNDDPIVIAHRGASGFRPEHTIEAYVVGILQGADFIEPDLVATKDGVLIARHENALATVAVDASGNIILDGFGRPMVTGATTNVAEKAEFYHLLTVKQIDGVYVGGWFSEDMTLAEIKTLRCRERIPGIRPDNTQYDDLYQVPTLSEIITLVKVTELLTGRRIGIYPETKHPTYFQSEGTYINGNPIHLSLGNLLCQTLVQNDFVDPDRIFIQSFEFQNLIELQTTLMPAWGIDIPLVQLYGDIDECCLQPGSSFSRPYDMVYNASIGADLNAIYGPLAQFVDGGITTLTHYGDIVSQDAIHTLAIQYAEGLGPWKNSFLRRAALPAPVDGNGDGVAQITSGLTGAVHPFLSYAFEAGLMVHPYTLRAEENFLTVHANDVPQTITAEVVQLLSLGVNGFFIDQPNDGYVGRNLWLELNGRPVPESATPEASEVELYERLMEAFHKAACEANPLYCR